MERYTIRQVKRALAQEQLLQRLDQGGRFEPLCQELGLSLQPVSLPYLRRRYREGGSTWEAFIDHRQGHAHKATAERRTWLQEQKQQNLALTQQGLSQRFADAFQVSLSQSQVSNILRAGGVAIPGGQRYHAQGKRALPVERAGVSFPPGGRLADEGAEYSDPSGPGAEGSLSET